MFKRSIFFVMSYLLVCTNAYASTVVTGSDVFQSDFHNRVLEEGNKIIARNNIDLSIYCYEIKQRYEDCLNRAVSRLNSFCLFQGFTFVNFIRLKDVVEEEIKSFVKFVETVVLSTELDSAVNNAVCDFIHSKGLVKNDVVEKYEVEYNARYKNVKNKLNRVMLNEYRDYLTKQEIEKSVKDEFTVFIARIKKECATSAKVAQQTGSSFLGWLLGTDAYVSNNSVQQPCVSASQIYDIIYKNQLEQQIVLVANSELQAKGYHQDTIPARVVSDYSDSVQRIIQDAKAKMNNYGREYLTLSEVKCITKNVLQPVFDKIRFKGETCSICLCNFSNKQEIGFLKCGHFFHADCIKQALDMSGKKCPLCRAYSVKSDIKIEYVPCL